MLRAQGVKTTLGGSFLVFAPREAVTPRGAWMLPPLRPRGCLGLGADFVHQSRNQGWCPCRTSIPKGQGTEWVVGKLGYDPLTMVLSLRSVG